MAVLQETRCSTNEKEQLWAHEWPGPSLWSQTPTPNTGGTAILVNQLSPITITEAHGDANGWLSTVKIRWGDTVWHLINIYAPPTDNPKLNAIRQLQACLSLIDAQEILIAGDFNINLAPASENHVYDYEDENEN